MRCSKKNVKFILVGKLTFKIIFYTLSCAKSNGTIHFVLSLKLGSLSIFRRPPQKPYIFSMQLIFFMFDRNFSQTKTFSQMVFFMFCLQHFSLKCIIKHVELKVNGLLNIYWYIPIKVSAPRK